ncbi:MAG: hypothetical protein WA395_14710, partial [Nitrososphaeraceae archaeon]
MLVTFYKLSNFDFYIASHRLENIDCIAGLGQKGLPYMRNGYKHFDLLNVYSQAMVKDHVWCAETT